MNPGWAMPPLRVRGAPAQRLRLEEDGLRALDRELAGRRDARVPAADDRDVHRVRELAPAPVMERGHRRVPVRPALVVAVQLRRRGHRVHRSRPPSRRRACRPDAGSVLDGCLVGDPAAGDGQEHAAGEVAAEQRRVLALRGEGAGLDPPRAPSGRTRRGRPGGPRRGRAGPGRRVPDPRGRAPGRWSAPRSPSRAGAGRRPPPRGATPSAVSIPLIPFAASPNSTALSTSVCGAWSVAMASAVPSARAARQAAASAAERSGGLTRSAGSNGGAGSRRPATGRGPRRRRRAPPSSSAAPRRSTRR